MQLFNFPTTISARDIQRGYKKIFDTVKKNKKPIVVMANNSPQAVIISLDMLEDYNRLQAEQDFWTTVNQMRAKNADKDPDEILKDITTEVEAVRAEGYEKKNNQGGR